MASPTPTPTQLAALQKNAADTAAIANEAHTPSVWQSFVAGAKARIFETLSDVVGSPAANQLFKDALVIAVNGGDELLEDKVPPLKFVAPIISDMETPMLTAAEQGFQKLVQAMQTAADAADKAASLVPASSPVPQQLAGVIAGAGGQLGEAELAKVKAWIATLPG